MLNIKFTLKSDTKTCYRFETGEKPEQMTLYLKKAVVDAAGIDPKKGLQVHIEEDTCP